jgi:Mrp family chromosome partitioning ATPase
VGYYNSIKKRILESFTVNVRKPACRGFQSVEKVELNPIYFENLRDVLFEQYDTAAIPRTIAFTSSYNGEGVTTIALNFAVILAMSGNGKVLLVDSNFGNCVTRDT